MRKLKKAFSLTLALALSLSLAVPAFADSTDDYSANGYTDPSAENVEFSVAPIGAATIRISSWETEEFTAYVFDQDCIVTRKDGLPLTHFILQDGSEGFYVNIGNKDFPYAYVDVAGISADYDHYAAFQFGPDGRSVGETDWSPYMMSKKGFDSLPIESDYDDFSVTVVEYRPLSGQPTTPTQPEQPAEPAAANPTNDKLEVNGNAADPTVYKINGSNYFKIRDVAAMLNGTEKQFAVGYDGGKNAVTATTGQGYAKQPGDLAGAPAGGSQTAEPSNDAIYVNGEKITAEVYKIGGSNYFKLRDLGKALNFYVGWSADRGMYIETDKPYSE